MMRDVKANVDVAGHTVIERDANSTMVINWTIAAAGPGSSVTVKRRVRALEASAGSARRRRAVGLAEDSGRVLENLKKRVEGR